MNTNYHFKFAQCITEAHMKERQAAVLSRATKYDRVQKAARGLIQHCAWATWPCQVIWGLARKQDLK